MTRITHRITRRRRANTGHARQRMRGFTLVELMVGLLVGLMVAGAAAAVLAVTESGRRSTLVVGDINQSGAYAMAQIDRWVRSAGSGFAAAHDHAYGCLLHASVSGTQVLPVTSTNALPAPFDTVDPGTDGAFRLAPVVIAYEQTTPAISGSASDVLIVMQGAAGQAEAPMAFTGLSTVSTLTVGSTLGVNAGDLLLLADRQGSSTGTAGCLVEQVSSSHTSASTTSLALAGTYYAATVDGLSVTDLSTDGTASVLGNVGNGNVPSFLLIGVGADNTLYTYDLLRTSGTPLQPMADGVFELHALYGLDTDGDSAVDTWSQPTGDYAYSALMDGSTAAAARLATIKAVRVGMILRAARDEKSTVAPASLSLFADLGSSLTYTRDLATAERTYRYRTVETTIPVRNNLLLPP